MRPLISFMHVSLDGFVAGPSGEMNWINVNADLFAHIGRRIAQCDKAVYGRVTYEMMEGYWPEAGKAPDASAHDIEHSRWYNEVNKVVLSRSLQGTQRPRTTILSDSIAEQVRAIKEEPGSEILLFGSPSATHALMELDLIDGYWLFLNPVLLGQGIPLFQNIRQQTKLKLDATQAFPPGVTELRYTVARS